MPRQRPIALFSHLTYGTLCRPEVSNTSLPTPLFYLTHLIPREAEDFPRGDKHFKHVPPPTYLIYLSLKDALLTCRGMEQVTLLIQNRPIYSVLSRD